MPASTGMVSARLAPPSPWHALQANALAYPGASIGPAAAGRAASRVRRSAAMPAIMRADSCMALLLSGVLAEDVVPDVRRPAEGVAPVLGALPRREPRLDLDHLALGDAIGVDDRHRLLIAHPAVAGVDRRHGGRLLAGEQGPDGARGDLSPRVGPPGRRVVDVRVRPPGRAEEPGLRDDVLVGFEHDQLRLRLRALQVPVDLAG